MMPFDGHKLLWCDNLLIPVALRDNSGVDVHLNHAYLNTKLKLEMANLSYKRTTDHRQTRDICTCMLGMTLCGVV